MSAKESSQGWFQSHPFVWYIVLTVGATAITAGVHLFLGRPLSLDQFWMAAVIAGVVVLGQRADRKRKERGAEQHLRDVRQ